MMATDSKPKAQRKFDIEATSTQLRDALCALEAREKPGQSNGKGSKTDVLEAAKADIQALLAKGYTAAQIANAITNDVFKILPKSITQIVKTSTRTRRKPVKAAAREDLD